MVAIAATGVACVQPFQLEDILVTTESSRSGSVNIDLVNADYIVSTPPAGGGSATSGDALSDTFILQNIGEDNGTVSVNWWAYLSADSAYSGEDILIDSGQWPALEAGTFSGEIQIEGTWHDTGQYYVIVRVQAPDEARTTNNVRASTNFVDVTSPGASVPDYRVYEITQYQPYVTTGSTIDEQISVTNAGAAGGEDITWTAYVSLDDTPSVEETVTSGTLTPLSANGSHEDIYLTGATWPASAGEYYLIIKVTSPDDPVASVVSKGGFRVGDPPDYAFSASTFPSEAEGTTGIGGSFTIRNEGTGNGRKNVVWEAYLSSDTVIGSDDLSLGSGMIAPLSTGGSTTIGASELAVTSWPFYGHSNILLRVTAGDDGNSLNNVYVHGPMELYVLDSEGADGNGANNSGSIKISSPTIYQNLNVVLSKGQTLIIRGWHDDKSDPDTEWDTFRLVIGDGVSNVLAYAVWHGPNDVGDLYVKGQSGSPYPSNDPSPDREPLNGALVGSGLTAGSTVYVGIDSNIALPANPDDAKYTLYITGQ